MAELLDQVGVANRVEQTRLGRGRDKIEVAGVQRIDVPYVVSAQVARVVEAPLVQEMHAANHVVPVVTSQNGFELRLVAGDEVRLRRQSDGDVARVPAATALDVLDVKVVLEL